MRVVRRPCLSGMAMLAFAMSAGLSCAQEEPSVEGPDETSIQRDRQTGTPDQPPAGPERKTAEADDTAGKVQASPATESLGLLVSVSELKQRLDGSGLRILDARGRDAYEKGHIPGAVHVDVGAWKSQALKGGGKGLRDTEAWSELVGGVGVDASTPVVVYADAAPNATRIWWTLKYVGVDQAAVLDGGWSQWTSQGGKTSDEPPDVKAVEFHPDFQTERLAEIDELQQALGAEKPQLTIVDSRSDAEYTGTGGPGARKGHVPGARHVEWKELLNDDGRFKSKQELRRLFEQRGVTPGHRAVTYCQTGGRASLDAFALELAGYDNVKNYYCGWSQWSAADGAPIEKPEK